MIVLEITGIAVTVMSIIVTIISIVQDFRHEKSNRDSDTGFAGCFFLFTRKSHYDIFRIGLRDERGKAFQNGREMEESRHEGFSN